MKLTFFKKESNSIIYVFISYVVAALNEQLRIEIERQKEATTLNEQQLKEAIALIEQLTAEVQQLKVARGEVMQNHVQFDGSNMQPLDANMFQQLNIDDQFIQPQQNLDFYGLQI